MYIAHASEIFYNKGRSGVGLIINLRHSSRAILLYIQLTCANSQGGTYEAAKVPRIVYNEV